MHKLVRVTGFVTNPYRVIRTAAAIHRVRSLSKISRIAPFSTSTNGGDLSLMDTIYSRIKVNVYLVPPNSFLSTTRVLSLHVSCVCDIRQSCVHV
jgi:hypothetical protein